MFFFSIFYTPGDTTLEPAHDLSLQRLSSDLVSLVKMKLKERPSNHIILVGHSVGGSVVMESAEKLNAFLVVLVNTIGGNADNIYLPIVSFFSSAAI